MQDHTTSYHTPQPDVLATIGNTPLIRLSRMFPAALGIEVFAKLELSNPGGSAKDRPALRMIDQAWRAGLISKGSTVIESSSGNMALSLAAICTAKQLRFICVVDPKTTQQHLRIIEAYGAEIVCVKEPDPQTGEYLQARLARVQQLLESIPGSYWPNQYGNPDNHLAHSNTTMHEIACQLGSVDYVFGGTSTCGTMLGCANYVREHRLPTRIMAVDALGSSLFGTPQGPRRFPGLGAGIRPPFSDTRFMDGICIVSDEQMVSGCRRLVREEAIMAGPSSGGVIAAIQQAYDAGELPAGSRCVAILHDRGERYLDSVFNDQWVLQQFGPSFPLPLKGADNCAIFE